MRNPEKIIKAVDLFIKNPEGFSKLIANLGEDTLKEIIYNFEERIENISEAPDETLNEIIESFVACFFIAEKDSVLEDWRRLNVVESESESSNEEPESEVTIYDTQSIPLIEDGGQLLEEAETAESPRPSPATPPISPRTSPKPAEATSMQSPRTTENSKTI